MEESGWWQIDCHCRESKREQNERKQVHLPQVYNPEITVCSGACLTALQAACASLLISSAPAVQELIWRFSESITLLSKVSLPERYTHTCMAGGGRGVEGGGTYTCTHEKTNAQRNTHPSTQPIFVPPYSNHPFIEVNCTTSDTSVLNQTLHRFVLRFYCCVRRPLTGLKLVLILGGEGGWILHFILREKARPSQASLYFLSAPPLHCTGE